MYMLGESLENCLLGRHTYAARFPYSLHSTLKHFDWTGNLKYFKPNRATINSNR